MEPPAHLRVLSVALMNRQTRAVVRRTGLEGVSAETEETYGEARAREALNSQFLPSPRDVAVGDVAPFLNARLTNLLEFLESRGVTLEDEPES
jgi:hypothetical protein